MSYAIHTPQHVREVSGVVLERRRAAAFYLETEDGDRILADLGAEMRHDAQRLFPGDRVRVRLDFTGALPGRIMERMPAELPIAAMTGAGLA